MSNEKKQGQSGSSSIVTQPHLKSGAHAAWVGAVAFVAILIAFLLKGHGIIDQSGFNSMVIAALIGFVLILLIGSAIGNKSRTNASRRSRNAIDKHTPSTNASRKLAEMSYEDLERQQRRAGNDDRH